MSRIQSLDTSRGVLVCGMIVFHVLLHLYQGSVRAAFLAFIPAGFLLFSGVLVSNVLQERKTTFQIVVRGTKLLVLFLLCNLILWLHSPFPLKEMAMSLIYANPQTMSFEILVPIAWTVILSPVFLRLHPRFTSISALSGLLMLDLTQTFPFTLKFFIIGVLGIGIGKQRILRFLSTDDRMSDRNAIIVALFSAILYMLLGMWNHSSWVLQTFFVVVAFSSLPTFIVRSHRLASALSLLGRHSLFLYVFHVMLIASLSRLFHVSTHSMLAIVVIALAVTAVCLLVAWVVSALTNRFTSLRTLYRFVFA